MSDARLSRMEDKLDKFIKDAKSRLKIGNQAAMKYRRSRAGLESSTLDEVLSDTGKISVASPRHDRVRLAFTRQSWTNQSDLSKKRMSTNS